MRSLLLLLLVVFMGGAGAQPYAPGAKPTHNAVEANMPAGKIYINLATIPGHRLGYNYQRVGISCVAPTSGCGSSNFPADSGSGEGTFRAICTFSHITFDDPIVWPRQSGRTHGHAFFGNTTTNSQSDPSQMMTVGRSTCFGGTANRTGYWVPFIVYHCPTGAGGCNTARDGEVIRPLFSNFYYKTTGIAVGQFSKIRWPGIGMQMIAGDPTNQQASRMQGRFDCQVGGNLSPGPLSYAQNHIPNSAEVAAMGGCDEVNMLVDFPNCWDGVSQYIQGAPGALYSGHVSYAVSGVCSDPAYSVPIPRIGFNIHTGPLVTADFNFYRLSSDIPESYGVTQAGSTTTQIHLAASESSTIDYPSGTLVIGSELRYISAFDTTTKVATVSAAFSTAPASGVAYTLRNPAGRTLHGDWAGGWDQTPNFHSWGRTLTQQIIKGCFYDPATTTLYHDCHDHLLGDPLLNGTYWWLF